MTFVSVTRARQGSSHWECPGQSRGPTRPLEIAVVESRGKQARRTFSQFHVLRDGEGQRGLLQTGNLAIMFWGNF